MTKDKGSSDTFGVVGQSSFLNIRRTGDRCPGELTLEQQKSQGDFYGWILLQVRVRKDIFM